MAKLREELKKRGPFASLEQEATLAILRTSDLLENRLARLLREYGLTPSQYNVLRILRGEGAPLPCLEVASRMIQVAPAITRVVDQLLKLKADRQTPIAGGPSGVHDRPATGGPPAAPTAGSTGPRTARRLAARSFTVRTHSAASHAGADSSRRGRLILAQIVYM